MIGRGIARLVLVGMALVALVGCTSSNPSPSPASSPTTSQPPAASVSPSATPGDSTAPPSDEPTAAPSLTPPPSEEPVESPSVPATPTVPPSGSFDPELIALDVELFAGGFTRLTFVTHAGDGTGTLYALEQGGRIVIVTPGDSQASGDLVDISDRVGAGGERGLLGLAFHPDFETNGRFFVNYTNKAGNTVVSEFVRDAGGVVDAAAERVLLRVDQPFPNHNGGMVAFGPDGYLYIGLGDGGSGGDPFDNGQRLDTQLGKILRIDVDSGDPYGIPTDNPFAGGQNGLPEIWSYGVRNPWRFSFDRVSGAMFMADVGQDEFEEINAEPAGAGGRNYGWSIMEADRCYGSGGCSQSGLRLPVATYSHAEGCSVTGGYVYRGGSYPQLFGGYVFADYCSGTLWALNADRAVEAGSAQLFELGRVGFTPSSFGEDEAGELYVVDHGGAIYRLVAVPR